MAPALVIAPLLLLALITIPLVRAYSEVDRLFVHDWARAHGLQLTTANRPLVWWYLRNARVLRTWGVIAGLLLPPLVTLAFGLGGQGVSTTWWCLFAGHLAGALFAEYSLRRPSTGGTRIATLQRREIAHYLPQRLRVAPAAITAVAAGLGVLGWVAGDLTSSTEWTLLLTLAAGVAIVAVIAAAQRWVLARPQPFTEPEMVAADDAIRSQSVHMLAGSGSAVLLAIYGAMLSPVAMETAPPLSTVTALAAFSTVPLSIVACLYYGHRAWAVRRQPLPRSAVSA